MVAVGIRMERDQEGVSVAWKCVDDACSGDKPTARALSSSRQIVRKEIMVDKGELWTYR